MNVYFIPGEGMDDGRLGLGNCIAIVFAWWLIGFRLDNDWKSNNFNAK
jgi:hypothetical protein